MAIIKFPTEFGGTTGPKSGPNVLANQNNVPGVRATPEAFGSAMGRGMQMLGAGIEDAAQQLIRSQEAKFKTKFRAGFYETEQQITEKSAKRKGDAAEGMTKEYEGELWGTVKPMYEEAPTADARAWAEEWALGQANATVNSLLAYERREVEGASLVRFQNLMTHQIRRVYDNPNLAESAIEDARAMLQEAQDAGLIGAARAAQALAEIGEKVYFSAARSRMRDDPARFLSEVEAGNGFGVGKENLYHLQDEAQGEVDRQKREARLQLTEQREEMLRAAGNINGDVQDDLSARLATGKGIGKDIEGRLEGMVQVDPEKYTPILDDYRRQKDANTEAYWILRETRTLPFQERIDLAEQRLGPTPDEEGNVEAWSDKTERFNFVARQIEVDYKNYKADPVGYLGEEIEKRLQLAISNAWVNPNDQAEVSRFRVDMALALQKEIGDQLDPKILSNDQAVQMHHVFTEAEPLDKLKFLREAQAVYGEHANEVLAQAQIGEEYLIASAFYQDSIAHPIGKILVGIADKKPGDFNLRDEKMKDVVDDVSSSFDGTMFGEVINGLIRELPMDLSLPDFRNKTLEVQTKLALYFVETGMSSGAAAKAAAGAFDSIYETILPDDWRPERLITAKVPLVGWEFPVPLPHEVIGEMIPSPLSMYLLIPKQSDKQAVVKGIFQMTRYMAEANQEWYEASGLDTFKVGSVTGEYGANVADLVYESVWMNDGDKIVLRSPSHSFSMISDGDFMNLPMPEGGQARAIFTVEELEAVGNGRMTPETVLKAIYNREGRIKKTAEERFKIERPTEPGAETSAKPEGGFTKQASEIVNRHAAGRGLDPALVKAVIKVESNFNPKAKSHAGAMGYMQLMPDTARDLGVADPWNPEENIKGGTRYLKMMMERYGGDVGKALAAYNWGPGNLDNYGLEKAPRETRNYIQLVRKYYAEYSK